MRYVGTVKTLHRNGHVTVVYDDSIKERLNLDKDKWKYENTNVNAITYSVFIASTDIYHELRMLQSMLDRFSNKAFIRQEAQGFELFALANLYSAEEQPFLKTFLPVPCSQVPPGAKFF